MSPIGTEPCVLDSFTLSSGACWLITLLTGVFLIKWPAVLLVGEWRDLAGHWLARYICGTSRSCFTHHNHSCAMTKRQHASVGRRVSERSVIRNGHCTSREVSWHCDTMVVVWHVMACQVVTVCSLTRGRRWLLQRPQLSRDHAGNGVGTHCRDYVRVHVSKMFVL